MLPMISVVVPVRNQRALLPKLIEELINQNYPSDRFEVLVVDGRSTDGSADLVRRRYSDKRVKVRVLDNPKMRPSAGRNVGIRAAMGDVIVFIDGHCTVPSKNLLEDTAAILQQSGAGFLLRPQPLLGPAPTPVGETIAQARANWLGHAQDPAVQDKQGCEFEGAPSAGAAYPREVFALVGHYDETLDACEDMEFNARMRKAGIHSYADSRLAVYDLPQKNVRGLFQQMFREGRCRIRLMRKHVGSGSMRQLAPMAILSALPLTALAWAMLPRFAAEVSTVPLALMMAAILAASFQLGVRHGFVSAWRAPRIFMGLYGGLGMGLLAESLMPARTVIAPAVVDAFRPRPELQVVEDIDRAA
jgi:succinoglycan biosynthesis protein ExoA